MEELVEAVSEGSDSDMLRAEEELAVHEDSDAVLGSPSSSSRHGDSDSDSKGAASDLNEDDEDEDDDGEPEGYCTNCTAPLASDDSCCEDCGHVRTNDGMLFRTSITEALDAECDGDALRDTRVALLFDERMELHEEGRANPHPERPDRIRAVVAKLMASGLASRCRRVECRPATVQELAAVHTTGLIHLVEEASQQAGANPDAGIAITSDTYVNAHTHLCARLAAGGAAEVAGIVARGEAPHGAAIVRPPGHHAESGMAMGFCFFNNAAVAARAAQAAGARRVIILDWDIHHGNGTQHMFEHDPSVLYISLHRYDHGQFYPGTGGAGEVGQGAGEGFTLNVPWDAADIQNGDYLSAFSQVVVPVSYEFNPDLIIVSAGFDAADGDPIGQCRVTPDGFAHMTAMLKPIAPTVLLLEGGYNLASTADSTEACLRVLLGEQPGRLTGVRAPSRPGCLGIQQAIQVHARYWSSLCATAELLSPTARAHPPLGAPGGDCTLGVCSASDGRAPAAEQHSHGSDGHNASAQPSEETQQAKRSSASAGGASGGGDVTSAEARVARRAWSRQLPGRRAPASAPKSSVLLAIHKRAMRAFWKRQRRMLAPPVMS